MAQAPVTGLPGRGYQAETRPIRFGRGRFHIRCRPAIQRPPKGACSIDISALDASFASATNGILLARPFLILDGYNVMHAAGFARFLGAPGALQAAREALLQYIAEELTELECRRTHVVFDAMNAPTHLQRVYQVRGITVEFASPGLDADSVIEDLIRDHTSPRQVRVISSDHRIQRAAKRRRCRFMDSEDWLARLEKRAARRVKSGSKPMSVEEAVKFGGQLAPAEVERWMREFNVPDPPVDD